MSQDREGKHLLAHSWAPWAALEDVAVVAGCVSGWNEHSKEGEGQGLVMVPFK